jgi:hypothetical protein
LRLAHQNDPKHTEKNLIFSKKNLIFVKRRANRVSKQYLIDLDFPKMSKEFWVSIF